MSEKKKTSKSLTKESWEALTPCHFSPEKSMCFLSTLGNKSIPIGKTFCFGKSD